VSTNDAQWLISEAAGRWLELAAAESGLTLKLAARLRKGLTAERARLVLEQTVLRRRAIEKFALAERMFFTPIGLEQASDQGIAAYKARRFAAQIAADAESADLCCGIGGDLLALAARGLVVGVDRDPLVALFAEANLAGCGVPPGASIRGRVERADAGTFDVRPYAAWHLDPDRRPAGRRTTRVAAHDPPPEAIDRLLLAAGNASIKLAPAAVLPEDWSSRAELEWISRKRECRQLVAWFGELATHPSQRRATVLASDGELRRTLCGEPNRPIPLAPHIGRYVFEPDAAVLAAKLEGILAAEQGLSAIAPGIAYLTSDSPLDDAALAGFEVLEILPLRTKMLKTWLAERGFGRLEVKKRGVDIDPERLRRELQVAGDAATTLLVTRAAGRVIVIAARRISLAI
jgi:THUMP domain-like